MDSNVTLASRRAKDYWDFKHIKGRQGIHTIAKYPASMVAPMQNELLLSLKNEYPNYQRMLDPFHGSGVTLIEASELGFDVYGIDINPYAHLITKTKFLNLSKYDLYQRNMKLIEKIKSNTSFVLHSFKNIQKWFRDDFIADLSRIRCAILQEEIKDVRLYYWLCFSEIVKKYSNTRTSTFKLHIKKKEDILSMQNNIVIDFIKKIENDYTYLSNTATYTLVCADALSHLNTISSNYFDVICTSPPYGDNATTVTYGQFSTLQLYWIDIYDLDCGPDILENYSKIDSMSMGGSGGALEVVSHCPAFKSFISLIRKDKRKKVFRFVADYEAIFSEMVRVIAHGGSIVLTLANRKVDKREFPLVDITKELAMSLKLSLKHEFKRNIQNKVMPSAIKYNATNERLDTMSEEIILVFAK